MRVHGLKTVKQAAGSQIPARSFVTGVPGKIKSEVSDKQVAMWIENRDPYITHILQKLGEPKSGE